MSLSGIQALHPDSIAEAQQRNRFRELSVADDATFEEWCAQPIHDQRTIEEYVADGGRPILSLGDGVFFKQPLKPWGGTAEVTPRSGRPSPPPSECIR